VNAPMLEHFFSVQAVLMSCFFVSLALLVQTKHFGVWFCRHGRNLVVSSCRNVTQRDIVVPAALSNLEDLLVDDPRNTSKYVQTVKDRRKIRFLECSLNKRGEELVFRRL
jgi:hypothetical protein